MNGRTNKAQELDNEIKRLASECKLDSWTSFVDEMLVPGDIYPALASGRPELIKLIQPRDLKADEAKVLFDIIATLIGTNMALREHAQQVAHFSDIWAQAFKQLHSVGTRVQRYANFEHGDAGEEDEG